MDNNIKLAEIKLAPSQCFRERRFWQMLGYKRPTEINTGIPLHKFPTMSLSNYFAYMRFLKLFLNPSLSWNYQRHNKVVKTLLRFILVPPMYTSTFCMDINAGKKVR